MKGAGRFGGVQDANGGRQGPVEGSLEVFGGNSGLQDKAGYLAQRVDAGIGAA
jgi:hypothetical protein